MSTRKIYSCNFCRSESEADSLVGVKWIGKALKLEDARGVENHICRTCLTELGDIYNHLSNQDKQQDETAK